MILSASRTPVGSFQGSLAGFKGSELGALAAKSAIAKAGIQLEDVNEAVMGNVVSANMGQAPARQAAIGAGLPWSVPCTTVNKVCSSGLKSVMFAAQSIMSGQNVSCADFSVFIRSSLLDCWAVRVCADESGCSDSVECLWFPFEQNVVLAGGFESMSQVPYYLPKARSGLRLGHGQITDGIVRDGLWDSFDDQHMGMCAEEAAESFNISREAQDAHAIESYRRAQAAAKAGWFKEEIVPVAVPQRGGEDLIIDQDQEITRFKSERVSTARPAFKKDGTVTPINSSSLNDGGAALIVASEEWAQERNLQPLARIVGMADAAQKPVRFTTAPSLAIPIAVGRAGISVEQVDNWEINEAFSVVSLVNNQVSGLDRLPGVELFCGSDSGLLFHSSWDWTLKRSTSKVERCLWDIRLGAFRAVRRSLFFYLIVCWFDGFSQVLRSSNSCDPPPHSEADRRRVWRSRNL